MKFTRSHVQSWASLAQNEALGAHTLILEDGPELPDSSHPAQSERDRAGQGSSGSGDEGGDMLELPIWKECIPGARHH
jgi:hypothetical protein